MRNRAIKVSMVKDEKGSTNETTSKEDFHDKAVIVAAMVDGRIQTLGRIVVTCIVADTVRRVVIARATRP